MVAYELLQILRSIELLEQFSKEIGIVVSLEQATEEDWKVNEPSAKRMNAFISELIN